jgi:dCTP deaminase
MGKRKMTVLSGAKIRSRLATKQLDQRLVVSPLLEPDEQLNPANASLDIRLGCEFALVSPSSLGAVDELGEKGSSEALARLFRRVYVPLGGSLVIHPHQLVLAQALEYLRLPLDLMAYVVGRSTWGRLGLTVATAVGIHPGYTGCLTLELKNLGETPLALRPGHAIAQLFFHTVQISGRGKSAGQYRGSVGILPKRISSAKTRSKLNSLWQQHSQNDQQLPVIAPKQLPELTGK